MGALIAMTIGKKDSRRLHIEGDATGSDLQAVLDAGVALLAASPSQLIVDVGDVTAAGSLLVGLLNDLALYAARLGKTVVLEVPDDAADWLTQGSLSPAIHVERIRLMQVPAKGSPPVRSAIYEAADGVARRQGRGFIASYGEGRLCAETGCPTTLSRYNSQRLCSLHGPIGSSRT
jgi:hypothetical protein